MSSVTVGLRACSPARPRHPASLPICVPPVVRLPATLSRRLLAETTWRFGYGWRHYPRRGPFTPIDQTPAGHTSAGLQTRSSHEHKERLQLTLRRVRHPGVLRLGRAALQCCTKMPRPTALESRFPNRHPPDRSPALHRVKAPPCASSTSSAALVGSPPRPSDGRGIKGEGPAPSARARAASSPATGTSSAARPTPPTSARLRTATSIPWPWPTFRSSTFCAAAFPASPSASRVSPRRTASAASTAFRTRNRATSSSPSRTSSITTNRPPSCWRT